jgi:hypothetical protein
MHVYYIILLKIVLQFLGILCYFTFFDLLAFLYGKSIILAFSFDSVLEFPFLLTLPSLPSWCPPFPLAHLALLIIVISQIYVITESGSDACCVSWVHFLPFSVPIIYSVWNAGYNVYLVIGTEVISILVWGWKLHVMDEVKGTEANGPTVCGFILSCWGGGQCSPLAVCRCQKLRFLLMALFLCLCCLWVSLETP